MRYDLFVWLKPDLSADQLKKEIKDLEEFQEQGKKLQSEVFGKKKLAYKIRGFSEGLHVSVRIECGPEKVSDLKTYLNRNEAVLRYLLTKVEDVKNASK